jgi:hypothetical protein
MSFRVTDAHTNLNRSCRTGPSPTEKGLPSTIVPSASVLLVPQPPKPHLRLGASHKLHVLSRYSNMEMMDFSQVATIATVSMYYCAYLITPYIKYRQCPLTAKRPRDSIYHFYNWLTSFYVLGESMYCSERYYCY